MLNSLYFRLNLTANLMLLVFLAATGWVLDNAYVESNRLSLRDRMLEQIYHLIDLVNVDDNGRLTMPLPSHLPDAKLALPDSGLYALVRSSDNQQLLWQSPSLAGHGLASYPSIPIGGKSWSQGWLADNNPYYLLGFGLQRTVKSGVYRYNFFLIAELNPLNRQLAQYRQRLWAGLLATDLLLLTLQTGLLRWGLKPLREVRKELGAIELGETSQINGHYPREIRQLTSKINSLLTQEHDRQNRYRNALADLAHSLKTPLAVLLSADETPENLPGIIQEQGGRMKLIVERQLQRAGTANRLENLKPVPVKPIMDRLSASLSKIYRPKEIKVSMAIDAALTLRCNEADLIELLGNVLDNAFKWAQAGVHIEGKRSGQSVSLSIQDDGPGIDVGLAGRLLQRGIRADESTPGNGIGLSIVSEIIEAYQGELRIETSQWGGAAVVLQFRQMPLLTES